jgi:hypothetical protein
VQAQTQSVSGDAQSMNSLSAPVVASTSENLNYEQEIPQNQSGSTTKKHIVQQGPSDEHLGVDNDDKEFFFVTGKIINSWFSYSCDTGFILVYYLYNLKVHPHNSKA